MNMTQNPSNSKFKVPPLQVIWGAAVAFVILLILIIWAYYAQPLSEVLSPFWNDKLVDVLVLIPAVIAATTGTLYANQFEKGEIPHNIWRAFAIGLWLWVAGEVGGMIYDAIYWDGTYPDFRVVDLLWLSGYIFLGLSLYYQVRSVYGGKNKKQRRLYLGIVAIALLVAAGLTNLAEKVGLGEGYDWIILFITVLYPVFDLTEGGTAIWLSFLFGRGQWSRPWWGLILFAMADGIETFYWLGGYDYIPTVAQKVLDFIAVAAYPAGYMVAGLALLSSYFILRYGEDSGLWKVKKHL
jgi:hypothetical protein